MPINALHVSNFKGIGGAERIDIRPITIFIGPNSSGKSSCIHALAALSQTVKLPNNTRPLVLDDEFASVHLGRFIEVIHSKSYTDAVIIGLEVGAIQFAVASEAAEGKEPRLHIDHREGLGKAVYSFKCTRRTQDTYLGAATLSVGDLSYEVKRIGTGYEVLATDTKKRFIRDLRGRPDGF